MPVEMNEKEEAQLHTPYMDMFISATKLKEPVVYGVLLSFVISTNYELGASQLASPVVSPITRLLIGVILITLALHPTEPYHNSRPQSIIQ